MLHIILVILKIIGIILAAILLLLLLAILMILFIPLRYELIFIKEKGELYGCGKVSYLLHLITVIAEYKDSKPDLKIKIFGITLRKRKRDSSQKRKKHRRRKAPDNIPREKESLILEEQSSLSQENITETEIQCPSDLKELADDSDTSTDKNQNKGHTEKESGSLIKKIIAVFRRIVAFIKGIPGMLARFKKLFAGIKGKLKNTGGQISKYLEILRSEETKQLLRLSRKEFRYLLKHFKPRRAKGYLRFGTGDPASTAELLGVIGLLLPIYSNKIQVYPDFENSIYEGRIQIYGHIRMCHLLRTGWNLYRDKNLKKFLKNIRA